MGKKLLRAALLAAALVLVLTTAAFAAEGDIHPVNATSAEKSGEDGYTVTYTNAAIADKQCVLLVVTGTYEEGVADYTISESTIQYIDQTAADSSGSVSFTYIPKSTPDSLVLLGVEGQSGPILLATVESKGVTVTGSVDYVGTTSPVAAIYDTAGQQVGTSVMVAGDGTYTLTSVPAGATYYVKVTKSGCVSTPVAVVVGEDGATAPDITLYGGDINSNGSINPVDLGFLLEDFGKDDPSAFAMALSDINENGSVNPVDLSVFLTSFGKDDVSIESFIA